MENSLIRKILLLIGGILVSSLMFFIAVTSTYDSFYKQNFIKDNSVIASSWSSSIDSRLNTIYEHVYDVATVLYRKVEIRPGSPEMDYVDRNGMLDVIESKVMASSDISAFFIIDKESDLFLYEKAGVLNIVENNNLKYFLKDYCIENNYSIRNRSFKIIDVNEKDYFYDALNLGKYVVGAVSDLETYMNGYDREGLATFFEAQGMLYPKEKGQEMVSAIDTGRMEPYFSDGYAVIPNRLVNSEAVAYLLSKSANTGKAWGLASLFMVIDSAVCVILTLVLIVMTKKRISGPIGELADANQKLAQGDLDYRLDIPSAGSSEFERLYGSFNEMSEKIRHLTIEQYDAEIKRQQNQLKMLRAQVKPHTFLNAINTINNMTYTGKPEDIRRYIAAFASFTRYMLYKAKDWTTVEEEIRNIDNYVKMQQIRFPESIEVIYEVDKRIYVEQIPYLVLFSLVQNSFKHAMSLEEKTYLTIKGEYYTEEGFEGFRLIEEDNGPGFSKEALQALATAEEDDPFTKEHLGLTNVRYSLNLIYHRDDLLRIANRENGGAHIELLIPETEVEDETADM